VHAYQPDRIAVPTKSSGVISRLFSQHPALFAGAFMSIAAMGTIFVNAIWFQPDIHPSPMFATRTLQKPHTLKIAHRAPSAAPKTNVVAHDAVSQEVLKEVQSALSVRGYYGGKVDGKFGSRTKKAIVSFQRDHSFEQDGKPSVRLLSQVLLSASAVPQEVPVPKTIAVKKPTEATTQTASTSAKTNAASGLIARIQAGLRNYGYEELVVDGRTGKQTKSAIQSFQLDYGMKITGQPSQSVFKKLLEIGAFKQT